MRIVCLVVIVVGFSLLLVGCVSTPLRMGAIPGKPYVVVGKGEGRATGLLIYDALIPAFYNSRFERAYRNAVQNGGGDDIINPVICESWFWLAYFNIFTTTISGDAIKYQQAEMPAPPQSEQPESKATAKTAPINASAGTSGAKTTAIVNSDDIVIQLNRLKELRDSGSLTQQEYESRRKAIIDKL